MGVTHQGAAGCYLYGAGGGRLMKVEGLPQGSDCTALPAEAARTAYIGPLEVRSLGAPAQVVMAYPAGAVRLTAANDTWTPAFLHKDHLGSVRTISGPDGTPEERTLYRPYGAQTELATATLNDDKSWLGERYDAGAGLQYLNARYYDPELAMFLQPDWFEVMQPGVGTNRYAYAWGDPVNLRDAAGNEAYSVSRDLVASPAGAHGFVAIITTRPENYPADMRSQFIEMKNESGNIPGVNKGDGFHLITISGTDSNNDSSLPHSGENKLVTAINEGSDVASIQQVASGGDIPVSKDFDADISPGLTDGIKDNLNVDLDTGLYDSSLSYQNNLDYDLFGGDWGTDGYNCHSYSIGLTSSVGVKNYPHDLSGADPGESVPPSSFSPSTRVLSGGGSTSPSGSPSGGGGGSPPTRPDRPYGPQ